MTIDIHTLIFVLGFTHLMQVLVFFHQHRIYKTFKGPGWWLMWSAAEAAGFGFMLLRNAEYFQPFIIIGQNLMIVAGTVFLYIGVQRFCDKKINLKIIIPAATLFLTGFLWFLFIDNNIQLRSGLINLTLAGFALLTAHSLITSQVSSIRASANFNAGIFVIHGAIFLIRSLMFFSGMHEEGFFTPTIFNILPYFDALIVSLLWTFGLIMMLNQRLNAEISKTKEDLRIIFNTSPDAAIITSVEDGMIVDINDGYSNITGYTREEMLGKTTPKINIWKNISDRNKVVTLIKNQGFCENYEALFIKKDGSEITGLMSAKLIILDGVPHIISITRDITARKKVEEALKESEHGKSELLKKMNEAQHIAMIGSWEWNLQTGKVWWSDECYRIFGLNVQDFLPGFEATTRFIHPEDFEKYRNSFEHSIQTGENLNLRFRVFDNNGQLKHCSSRGNVLYNDSGIPVRFTGTVMDITEVMQSEDIILKTSRIYAFISQINQAIVHLRNKNAIYKEVCRIAVETGKFNMAWIGLIEEPSKIIKPVTYAGFEEGYLIKTGSISINDQQEENETAGTAIRNGQHFICNDIENDPSMALSKDEAIKRGYRSSITLPIKLYDNVIGSFSLYSNTPYFFDNEEIALLDGVTDDIGFALEVFEKEEQRAKAQNDLLLSETRHRRLHESMTDCFVQVNMDGKIVDCNRSYLTILGYTPDEIFLLKYQDITPAKWQKIEQEIVEKQILQHGYSGIYEKEYIRKNGSVFPVELRTYLLRDDHSQPVGMWSIVRDITDRKIAEQEIMALYESLEQRVEERTSQLTAANKELEAFCYSVSHDLRAPLRGIHGFTKILVDDYGPHLDDDGKRICSVIVDNSLKMGQLIDDLLAFSRLGRAEIRFSVINMKELINSTYLEEADQATRNRINLNVGDLCLAQGDPVMIRQVWSNLLSNAVKYSSKREIANISITSKQQEGKCIYCISDNGAGFNMRYVNKLFGVFQRLHSSNDYSGTGVGLAIVHRIIQRHGGEVWAEGEEEKGASFYFSLPVSILSNH